MQEFLSDAYLWQHPLLVSVFSMIGGSIIGYVLGVLSVLGVLKLASTGEPEKKSSAWLD